MYVCMCVYRHTSSWDGGEAIHGHMSLCRSLAHRLHLRHITGTTFFFLFFFFSLSLSRSLALFYNTLVYIALITLLSCVSGMTHVLTSRLYMLLSLMMMIIYIYIYIYIWCTVMCKVWEQGYIHWMGIVVIMSYLVWACLSLIHVTL